VCALYRALVFMRRQPRCHHLVYTDTLTALRCLSGHSPYHPIVAVLLQQVSNLRISAQYVMFCWLQYVMFCWLPGHCDLPVNEPANAAAKVATVRGQLVSDRALGTGVCTCLLGTILSWWQTEWDSALGNKLRMVKSSVQEWQSSFRSVLKDLVTLTHLTQGHWLRGEPAPVCTQCGAPLTAARTLVGCPLYAEARRICDLDGVFSDISGYNPCLASNVLAFDTKIVLAPVI
jgi:hypothetical protein